MAVRTMLVHLFVPHDESLHLVLRDVLPTESDMEQVSCIAQQCGSIFVCILSFSQCVCETCGGMAAQLLDLICCFDVHAGMNHEGTSGVCASVTHCQV